MTLAIAEIMRRRYYQNKLGVYIIYGEMGIGKSVYSILALKELGLDWRECLVFTPEEFLAKAREAYLRCERLKALVADDAGFWLTAYEWHDPWVKAFVKFVSVARPVVANIIMTTPAPQMLVRKLLTLDTFYVKVVRDGSLDKNGAYLRRAKGYKNIMLPSGQRRVKLIFEDRFRCLLPDEEYEEYQEYRRSYVGEGITELMRALQKRQVDNTIQDMLKDLSDRERNYRQ